MAITISGENNNDRILAADGVIDQISGINFSGIITASHINVGSNIQLGNAGIVTATTFIGDVTGNINSTSNLLLQISGSERFRVGNNGQWGIGGANYGTSGQVFTSGGSGGAPSWTTIPTQVTISNNADNRVITGGSGVNLNGEANLTFNGSTLHIKEGNSGLSAANANADTVFIENSANAGITIATPNTNTGYLIFADPEDDNIGQIIYRHGGSNANSMGFFVNASERLRIDSTGALRVNTTRTQATKLHVVGGTASGTAYDVAVFAGGQNSTQNSGVKLYLSGCENDPLDRGVILESIMTDNSNAHRFSILVGGSSAAPTERFRLPSDGRAYFFGNQSGTPNGIFGFRYDRNNDTDLSIENLNNSSVNNNAGIRLASNHGNIKLRYFNNGGFYIANSSDSGYLHYYEGSNSRLYIDTSGHISQGGGATPSSTNGAIGLKYGIKSSANNVIIGETTQSGSGYGLHIESRQTGRSGNARIAQIGLKNDASGNGQISLFTSPSGADVTERMVIDSSGRNLVYGTLGSGNLPLGGNPANAAIQIRCNDKYKGIAFGEGAVSGVIGMGGDDTSTAMVFTANAHPANLGGGVHDTFEWRSGNSGGGGPGKLMTLDTSGDLTLEDGDLVIGTSGHGIDFSATANGGTGTPSELLDDYEEGYFAPEVTNLSSGYASGTFYNRQARYTKIGNMVNCWVHLQWWANAVTSGSDNLEFTITGFPFEVDGVGYSGSCGGGLQAQSWRYAGSGFNNYAVDSHNVQPRINSLEQIRFGVFKHNSITGQVTQKSINGYSPNIEFFFSVRVTSYK